MDEEPAKETPLLRELEVEVNNALMSLVDFLLEVAYLPPLVEVFGGREAARKILYETVHRTDLATKINSIYVVESALNELTTKFASLWIRGFKKTNEYKFLERTLVKGGLIYLSPTSESKRAQP